MANNKEYVVVKNGEQLKSFKTLNPAKKLAEAEGGQVFCEGKCVYQPDREQLEVAAEQVEPAEETVIEQVETAEETAPDSLEKQDETATEVTIEKANASKKAKNEVAGKYRLKAFMNVRKKPSLGADRLGTKLEGSIVNVVSIDRDFLQLEDGTFILYGGGRYAEKL